jgi:hypothetical protein
MRRMTWMVAAAAFSLAACGGVTSPTVGGGGGGGGGPVGLVTVGNSLLAQEQRRCDDGQG